MNSSLQSLAGTTRRAFGFAGEEVAGLKQEIARRPGAALLRRKRAKIALFAILFGVFSAVIELPLPLEDLYRAARAQLRSRPAPQDIAFIAVDDATIAALAGKEPTRAHHSKVIDNLIGAGVTMVAFDSGQADPSTPKMDAMFEQTLARHQGKVWLGFSPALGIGSRFYPEIAPLPQFRKHVNLAAMNGRGGPFGLSVRFPTRVRFEGAEQPSLSGSLANYKGPTIEYRPDYAFDPSTIPTMSYLDVLNNTIPVGSLKGKRVIIGHSNYESTDFHALPFNSEVMIPGSYFHIMGAHSLKRGVPVDLMWFPAVLLAGLVAAWQMAAVSRSQGSLRLAAVGLLALPLVFDEFGVNIDIMPALLLLLFAGIGFYRLNRKYYSNDVDAMTTSAISSDRPSADRDVYALKIANLAELSEEWSAREIGDFVNTMIAYVKGPGAVGDVAFERDLLVWLAPRMDTTELELHADGLALMLKTAISYDWQSSNSAPALGIDTNYALPVGSRIKKAMQAADEAASRGVRFIINDAAHLEARNNRAQLVRVLEKGLRDRDIGVAYQPKVDLASGRIVGAETLIRWRPEGGGYVNPLELVLAAEAGDRINELTLVVMEAALADGKQAIALDPRFKLAVNMSAKSLSDTHLLFDIMTMLGRHNFPPENLTLELTETAKLEDDRIAPQIAALKARGIGLSIDDFGTGQSNLEYIEKLPSSELKIDKRFVQHMATSEESRAVVRATIEIAHSLGKVVVAEGVEDEVVAATLRAMGCDQAQGYLYAQAITMPELLAMMGRRRIAISG
jgi:EAL domain-containing protein (putative c-di-GMP-specific phosphodiesterase class I)/CHASE2 domain-containing sensor protein